MRTRMAFAGAILRVSVVRSVMTKVADRPGMQPITMPRSVAAKASASDIGLKKPMMALAKRTRPSNMSLSGQPDQKDVLEQKGHRGRNASRDDERDDRPSGQRPFRLPL